MGVRHRLKRILTRCWAGVRRVLWQLEGKRQDASLRELSDDAFKARLEASAGNLSLAIGHAGTCRVAIRNESPCIWPSSGAYPVQLAYRWLIQDDASFCVEGDRTSLPYDLGPGEQVTVSNSVKAPNTPGHYVLEFDLIQEGVARFKDKGAAPARTTGRVVGLRPGDFGDYQAAWDKCDLAKDYWSIVGPATEDEFNSLGKGKVEILTGLGLSPDSRLLDVGCGTGLLANGLMGFLSDKGYYYGTDITEKAVEFCASKYRRPNFTFLKNEMTAIPIQGVVFDFIVFFSVFTHTYPDETDALLADALQLLAGDGAIVADVFVSQAVETYTGNRAMIELNADEFYRRASKLGLTCQVIHEWFWDEKVRRLLLKLTRGTPA